MFSSTCQGLQLRRVDARFERGCLVLRCLRWQSRQFPALMGAHLGSWLEQQNSPPLPHAPTQWQPPSKASSTIWKSSAAFRIGLSQLQLLGEGEAHLLSRGVIFTMQVTVLMLLGKIGKIHEVHGVRLQGDWIKAEPLPFLGGGLNKSASKSYSEIIRECILFCNQSWEKNCRPSANDNIKDLLWNVSEDGDCGFLSLSRTHCPSVIESPWRHLAAPVYVFLPQKLNELKFQ